MTINDFAENYARSGFTRLHMPGHKGMTVHGMEKYDITEIQGADSLYEADGIIAQSERRTSDIFGSQATFYSAEGSSLSIKASLCIIRQYLGRPVTVAAPRNCHRAFLSGCALLDADVKWIYPEKSTQRLCESGVTPQDVERVLKTGGVDAVYITSPDYLGNIADIAGISRICRENGAFLICDNAHGAYLKFLKSPLHPLDLGADIVCDSAHKTLPVYTGGAYLHISKSAPSEFCRLAKGAMVMFGSTSPSYLIMASLDKCADLLGSSLPAMIRECCIRVGEVSELMEENGMKNLSAEPMKITIDAEGYGFSGNELADIMRRFKIECEYSDPAVTVLMFSPYNTDEDYRRLEEFIHSTPRRSPLTKSENTAMPVCETAVSVREAMLARSRRIPVDSAEGMVCARPAMACQPSVAVIMAGEKITAGTIKILKRYSIFEIDVL